MSYEQSAAELKQEQNETIEQELAQEYAEFIGEDGQPQQQLQQSSISGGETGESGQYRSRSTRTPEEIEAQKETDSRSVYVGNVDYKATPEELDEYFRTVGTINRVTILFDRFTGYPKGYAYVEFESQTSVEGAIGLSGSEFKGRKISVTEKRTNVPGFRRGRGRGGFRGGRGGGRGGSFRGRGNGRGGSFRGRGGFRGGRGGFRGDSEVTDGGVEVDASTKTHETGAELLA